MRINIITSILGATLAAVMGISNLAGTETKTIYNSQNEKSVEQALGYVKSLQCASRYLSYRDMPEIIAKYVRGSKTLDYGSGTGISTKLLLDQGLDVIGVDISKEMLAVAKENYPDTPFQLVEKGCLPLDNESFDFVFSSKVLFEIDSREGILEYLKEGHRVLKNDGVFIAITGSQDMYTKDWGIYNVDYPQNKNLKSGDLGKIYLYDVQIEFTDFYWTEADYLQEFAAAGFNILEIHYPLGREDEPFAWKDEKVVSPFVIFIAKKFH